MPTEQKSQLVMQMLEQVRSSLSHILSQEAMELAIH